MASIKIYTDGACSGNPGPGGWAAVIKSEAKTTEISGGEALTTNNRMELRAVIEALKLLDSNQNLKITTDSTYVKNGITAWIYKWQRNNWRTANKKEVKNKDLWQSLWNYSQKHSIEWQWVRGHSGHLENERCDQLARDEIKKLPKI